MKISGIYKITNTITGDFYIGSSKDVKKRWANHKCCNSPNMIIAKAIKKYGVENFKFEILFQGLSIEEAEEKELIRKILEECGGKISRAARMLGMSRPTLYKKMERYGLR